MSYEEACAWLRGERSMTNIIQSDPDNNRSWIVATAQADAAMTEQAYWIARAHCESVLQPNIAVSRR